MLSYSQSPGTASEEFKVDFGQQEGKLHVSITPREGWEVIPEKEFTLPCALNDDTGYLFYELQSFLMHNYLHHPEERLTPQEHDALVSELSYWDHVQIEADDALLQEFGPQQRWEDQAWALPSWAWVEWIQGESDEGNVIETEDYEEVESESEWDDIDQASDIRESQEV